MEGGVISRFCFFCFLGDLLRTLMVVVVVTFESAAALVVVGLSWVSAARGDVACMSAVLCCVMFFVLGESASCVRANGRT